MNKSETGLAQSAKEKLTTGALMTLGEVAAILDVAPHTVHGLSLPSVRLGRVLRFEPKDVRRLIAQCKEPSVA